jgi:hypothetical protein
MSEQAAQQQQIASQQQQIASQQQQIAAQQQQIADHTREIVSLKALVSIGGFLLRYGLLGAGPWLPLQTIPMLSLPAPCSCVQAVSLPRGFIVWETTRVFAGSVAYAALRLARGDGYPVEIAAEAVEAQAMLSHGDAAGAGGGAGGGTALPVTLAPVSLGVYRLSIGVPVDSVGCSLALHVHVRGVGDVEAPLEVECMSPLVFDPAAGKPIHRTIGGDGATLTTVVAGQLFRGRTSVLHTGPGLSFDIGLELQCTGNSFAIALGGVDLIKANTYDYSSNTGLSFFWNVPYGGVNTASYGKSTGHAKLQHPGTLVCHFRIRGNTLTFAAGPTIGSMVEQAGSWTLPNDFFLLISGHNAGNVVRLFSP